MVVDIGIGIRGEKEAPTADDWCSEEVEKREWMSPTGL
jgi:hypothetical protein